MMSCLEFRLLPAAAQVSLLYSEGVFLGKRKLDQRIILLYQIDQFYVELKYLVYRQVISNIRIADSMAVLDPYLEQIDVEDLVNET